MNIFLFFTLFGSLFLSAACFLDTWWFLWRWAFLFADFLDRDPDFLRILEYLAIFSSMLSFLSLLVPNSTYRMTIPLVQNLPLSSKQKFRFGLSWPGQQGRSRVLCKNRQSRQTDCLIPVQNLIGVKQSVCLGWLCLHDTLDLLCWTGQNGTFVLMSPVGFEQVELSPWKCSTRRFQTNQTFKITSQSKLSIQKNMQVSSAPCLVSLRWFYSSALSTAAEEE